MLLSLLLSVAQAGPTTTRDALDRLEEVLQIRVENGLLDLEQALPAILVQVEPRYEGSTAWFATGAIESLERALGRGSLRLCEACMVPRVWVEDGHMAYQSGPIGLDEVARLDASGRGGARPARSVESCCSSRCALAAAIANSNPAARASALASCSAESRSDARRRSRSRSSDAEQPMLNKNNVSQ